MVEELEYVSRVCFLKTIPSINCFRSYCGYAPLKPEECPEDVSSVVAWLADVKEDKTQQTPFKPLLSMLSEVSPEPHRQSNLKKIIFPSELTSASLFPKEQERILSKEELRTLYHRLIEAIASIPSSFSSWSSWLGHFDSAWMSVSWSLPSQKSNLLAQSTSLYDQSKVKSANFLDAEDLLLIQGDFQGIQNFIFSEGAETNKYSSKLLRGRSFYVSLIAELAALRVSRELGLPPLSPLMNAAGKFLICAPSTKQNIEKLKLLRKEFNTWFLQNTLGLTSLALSWTEIQASELYSTNFNQVMRRVFESTEEAKLSAFDLPERTTSVLDVKYPEGVNSYDARLPKESRLCKDEIIIGESLVKTDLILISSTPLRVGKVLELPIFGFYVSFAKRENLTPKDFACAEIMWDFSLPESPEEKLFKGIAKRSFNCYVARFSYEGEEKDVRYSGINEEELCRGEIKPFSYLACDNSFVSENGFEGIRAIAAVKGDVDDLGLIFRNGLTNAFNSSTLAGTMTLSRQLNSFFAVYLPVLFAQDYPNIYTVFAGGDDFFLIGPWNDIFRLSSRLQQEFERYCLNETVHFSAGITVLKSSVPVRAMARMAEGALGHAKESGKNSITAYGLTVTWEEWLKLAKVQQNLDFLRKDNEISSSYLYKLLEIMELRERQKFDPMANIWRSRLYYTTVRMIKDRNAYAKDSIKEELLPFIVSSLDEYGLKFKIALFNSLYTSRKIRS